MAHIETLYDEKDKPRAYKAYVEMGKDPATGRRKRKTKTFKKKGDAKTWTANMISERDNGIAVDPTDFTMAEYLKWWLEDIKPSLSPTTFDGYNMIVNTHLIPALGAIKVKDLQPMHIKTYITKKRFKGRADGNSGGLSERTLLHHFRLLNKSLKTAVKLQLIKYNPGRAVDAPTPKKKEVQYMTKEQLHELLEAAEGWIYNFIFVGAYTGMRRGELLGLRWSDVEFENKVIRVSQTLVTSDGNGAVFKPPKTKSSRRSIAISNNVINVLKEHKKMQTKIRLQLGPKYKDKNNKINLVFSKEDGTKYYPTTINRKFNKALKKTNLPSDINIHTLRHTHATLLLQAGEKPKVIQERLGHSSITETMDTYSHVIPTMQQETADKFDNLMNKL